MSDCEFCRYIKGTKEGNYRCLKSNLQAFKKCYQSEELYVYKCHAGLVEAMIHLRIKDTIVGYIMFGQISDIEDGELRYKNIILENNFNENSSKIKEIINSLKYLSEEEIQSAKTILLALAKYTVSEKLVSVRKEKFRLDLDNYLEYISFTKAKQIYGDSLTVEVSDRLKYELKIIKHRGASGYFLFLQDVVNTAQSKFGVWISPGRGSAANCMVCYCLGITKVDPLKFDMQININ
jgi:DNA polymerase III alpha subunit